MRTLKLSLRRGRQGFLSVIVPALFLVLALRPGPAAALADALREASRPVVEAGGDAPAKLPPCPAAAPTSSAAPAP